MCRRLLRCPNPILFMRICIPYISVAPWHTGNPWTRLLEMFHLCHREQGRIHTITSSHNFTLTAHENNTSIGIPHHLSRLKFFRSLGQQTSVIPIHFYFRHIDFPFFLPCRKGVLNHLGVRW